MFYKAPLIHMLGLTHHPNIVTDKDDDGADKALEITSYEKGRKKTISSTTLFILETVKFTLNQSAD